MIEATFLSPMALAALKPTKPVLFLIVIGPSVHWNTIGTFCGIFRPGLWYFAANQGSPYPQRASVCNQLLVYG